MANRMNSSLKQKIEEAPSLPGCYLWKDKKGKILYIGKAVNLSNRVNSYVQNYKRLDPKIRKMVDKIADIDYYTVDSEVEALILETNLIKKYKPRYNKLMKDDKNYSWVMIDWYNDLPSINLVREKDDKKAEYYGPYPNRSPVFKVLRRLRKIFPYCGKLPKNNKNKTKPCFDYHIGLCSGICAGLVSKKEHRQHINAIRKFFKGKRMKMINNMKKQMNKKSDKLNFEEAAELRDKINDLEYVTQRIKIGKEIDEIKLQTLKKDYPKEALKTLINKLDFSGLKYKRNFRIECYDISNISGTNAVGSMIVFQDGRPVKNQYRKFKIRNKATPDDFAMMQEVIKRRLKYLSSNYKAKKSDSSFRTKPNLIIVDGGKAQLSSAYEVLKRKGLEDKIYTIGLAKKFEEIYKIKINNRKEEDKSKIVKIKFKKIRFSKRSKELYLIQRIRDEAHRFAIGYHRKIRSKGQTKSILDDIPGVGKVTKRRLIEAFGNVNKIRKASKEELQTVIRNKRTVEAIKKILT
ncbi:hypothetical protein GF362_02305 [Candidatus Dojkabacteria bacterium]|nr:hypothetical protein [Candidatus Dojkabacteria bacterium]